MSEFLLNSNKRGLKNKFQIIAIGSHLLCFCWNIIGKIVLGSPWVVLESLVQSGFQSKFEKTRTRTDIEYTFPTQN